MILPFEEVVAALGRVSEHEVGLELISLESIVGTVDRDETRFDRAFLPISPDAQERWQPIATARRHGAAMPPIDVYRIGELHFVKDGHHRVSVARALGDETIEAHVVEVTTRLGADAGLRVRDLPLRRHERVFYERIYLRIAMLRYLLLQTHEWTDEVVERVLGEVRPPSRDDDMMVHQILDELR